MKVELKRLEIILNLNLLANVKENLKDDLMNPFLKWSEKLDLYESLQCINNRMDLLNQRLLKKSS